MKLLDKVGFNRKFPHRFTTPNLYLDRALIEDRKLDQVEIERVLAHEVTKLHGVALAVSASDLWLGGQGADAEITDQVRRNYHPDRSGEVYVIQDPQWQVNRRPSSGEAPAGTKPILLSHGTPWSYDTYVPIAIAGGKVPAALVSRQVHTVDVAPTLAILLGTKLPSGSIGAPLTEVLDSNR